jgi:uncharacterized protein (TIGR03032 family)
MAEDKPTEESAPPLPPWRSVHTANLPPLLQELGIALLVTTYQAGKLVVLRADGDVLNTHFCTFPSPMGLAVAPGRLALGTQRQIWQFRDVPWLTQRLEPAGKHDGCFVPRYVHLTGQIFIHEMAFSHEPELWFVNTRFSCLCTSRSLEYNFEPRWRPPFITVLAPEDRCHLNGLGLVEGRPGYVTAHGETDSPGGWRTDKARGGIVIDVAQNAIVARGLSMPHSPRWYDGRLWVLESGAGSLGVVNRASGRYEAVAELPGFTRGLDFYGPYAFIGLSQVRETATFSGLPITERLKERLCGVAVFDLRRGETVAYVKFEGAVQEIFAVQVLPGYRFPVVCQEGDPVLANAFVLEDEALRAVPENLVRSQSSPVLPA